MQSTVEPFHSCRTISSASIHQSTATSSIRNPFLAPIMNHTPYYRRAGRISNTSIAPYKSFITLCVCSPPNPYNSRAHPNPFVTSLPPHAVVWDSRLIHKRGRFPRSITGSFPYPHPTLTSVQGGWVKRPTPIYPPRDAKERNRTNVFGLLL